MRMWASGISTLTGLYSVRGTLFIQKRCEFGTSSAWIRSNREITPGTSTNPSGTKIAAGWKNGRLDDRMEKSKL